MARPAGEGMQADAVFDQLVRDAKQQDAGPAAARSDHRLPDEQHAGALNGQPYHFAAKDDLVREVLATVVARFTDFVRPLVDAETAPSAKLPTVLQANVDFMRGHRSKVVTLIAGSHVCLRAASIFSRPTKE